jgi:hypothetical protein
MQHIQQQITAGLSAYTASEPIKLATFCTPQVMDEPQKQGPESLPQSAKKKCRGLPKSVGAIPEAFAGSRGTRWSHIRARLTS